MTPTKRIGLNVIASYGRSLVALACGLLAGRWALMALGPVDFGLFGVVGGVVGFVGFLNGVLGLAVGRFFAFEIGREKLPTKIGGGLQNVRLWFSTAVFLHLVVPLALVTIGWPVGEWVVREALTIPAGRVAACVIAFRVLCLSCLVGMMCVPFSAMYTAKQKIAELTVYDIVANVAKVIALYLMAAHPGDWLAGYAVLMAAVAIVPTLFIAGQAIRKFPECRLVWPEMLCRERIVALLRYAGWECFGSGAVVLKNSGGAMLVNEYLGPAMNSSMAFSNSVAQHTAALSSSLTGAFYPAITNAYGAGDLVRARNLAVGACRYGGLLVLLFAVPMALEADFVFALWLKTPPPGVSTLCVYVLAATFIERLTSGCGLVVNASGRIARYQFVGGLGLMLAFPLMWCGLWLGAGGADCWGVHALGVASVVAFLLNGLAKIWYARKVAGMCVSEWLRRVLLPVGFAAILSLTAGGLIGAWLPASCWRAILTGFASALGLAVVYGVLALEERVFG